MKMKLRWIMLYWAIAKAFALVAGGVGSESSPFQLEGVTVTGSERLTRNLALEVLDLYPGCLLDAEIARKAQQKLAELQFLTDVQVSLDKGQKPGWGVLRITAKDNPALSAPWAFKGAVAAGFGQTASSSELGVSYQLGFESHNSFLHAQKMRTGLDLDAAGKIHGVSLSYFHPRPLPQPAGFKADFKRSNHQSRYLETIGFATRVSLVADQDDKSLGEFSYGLGYFANTPDDWAAPGFPEKSIGPIITFRPLNSEIPFTLMLKGLLALNNPLGSTAEAEAFKDLFVGEGLLTGLHAQFLLVPDSGVAARLGVRHAFSSIHGLHLSTPHQWYGEFALGLDKTRERFQQGMEARFGLDFVQHSFTGRIYLQIGHF